MMTKDLPCEKCGHTKKHANGKCASCVTDSVRKYREALSLEEINQIHVKTRIREATTASFRLRRHNRLVREYGLSLTDYETLFQRQNGMCAICQTKPEQSLSVDHDHKTGQVRGLLCIRCNTGLGYVDNEEWLSRAIQYKAETLEIVAPVFINPPRKRRYKRDYYDVLKTETTV